MNKMLSAAMAALLLSACDKPAPAEPAATETPAPADVAAPAAESPSPPPAPAETPTATAAPAQPAPAADAAGEKAVDDSIDNALGDHTRYRTVIEQFQKAVAAKDAAAVAMLVQYPFVATIDGKKVTVKDPAGFVSRYDKIVTPPIADAIVKQKYADLFVNYKGVMFGDGQAWVNGICKDNACKAFDVKVVAIQSGP